MAETHFQLEDGKKIPALDGLRGIAIVLVLTYHFGLLRFGWMGVGLFFALSGYLITRILLDTRELSLGKYLGRFYWRRALRILPLYFGFVLAVMLVFWITGKPSGAGMQFPWLATFTYNLYMGTQHQAGLQQIFHVLWSISTEEQFYFVWPMIVWLLPRRAIVVLVMGMILAAPFIRWMEPSWARELGIRFATEGKLIYYFPFGHVDAFAVGALLAVVRVGAGQGTTPTWQDAPWMKRPLMWGIALCLPAVAIMVRQFVLSLGSNGVPLPNHLGFPVNTIQDGFHIWGYSAGYICFAGLLILCLYGNRRLWLRRFTEWEPMRFLGRISFGLYVFHWPLLLVFEQVMPLSENILLRLVQWLPYMLVLVTMAWMSFRWYESWFLRQKGKLF